VEIGSHAYNPAARILASIMIMFPDTVGLSDSEIAKLVSEEVIY